MVLTKEFSFNEKMLGGKLRKGTNIILKICKKGAEKKCTIIQKQKEI